MSGNKGGVFRHKAEIIKCNLVLLTEYLVKKLQQNWDRKETLSVVATSIFFPPDMYSHHCVTHQTTSLSYRHPLMTILSHGCSKEIQSIYYITDPVMKEP